MRWLLVGMVIWTVAVVAILLLVPSPLNTQPCASLTVMSEDCTAQMRAMNDHLWLTFTLPVVSVIVGGYVAVVFFTLRARGRRGR